MFYSLKFPCPHCKSNTWHFDNFEAYRTRGKVMRFGCFYCGEDVFLNHPPADILRSMYSGIASVSE